MKVTVPYAIILKLIECRKKNPLSKSLKELDILINGDTGQLKSARQIREEVQS